MTILQERPVTGDQEQPAAQPLPNWFFPQPGGWTAEDLDHLPPEAPRRVELIDGALVPMSPQAYFHMLVINRLWQTLESLAPGDFEVVTEMTVTLDKWNRLDGDVLVVRSEEPNPTGTDYRPEDVTLIIEVVSPESKPRDRNVKPIKYAKADIPYFWRIERAADRPVVYTFELDTATSAYAPTGIHRDRLKLDVPFPIDIDLATLTRRR
jgi:Uma2 family endonuclease